MNFIHVYVSSCIGFSWSIVLKLLCLGQTSLLKLNHGIIPTWLMISFSFESTLLCFCYLTTLLLHNFLHLLFFSCDIFFFNPNFIFILSNVKLHIILIESFYKWFLRIETVFLLAYLFYKNNKEKNLLFLSFVFHFFNLLFFVSSIFLKQTHNTDKLIVFFSLSLIHIFYFFIRGKHKFKQYTILEIYGRSVVCLYSWTILRLNYTNILFESIIHVMIMIIFSIYFLKAPKELCL